MAEGLSSSQRTFRRENDALVKMPTMPGAAACENNTDFDVLAEFDKVAQDVRNGLAKICAGCALLDCGWRQVYAPVGYAKKISQREQSS